MALIKIKSERYERYGKGNERIINCNFEALPKPFNRREAKVSARISARMSVQNEL